MPSRAFDLKDFEFVIAVFESGAFARAAIKLGTVQSNVSARIGELETALGVKLFVRQRHGVDPTPQGARLYRRAKHIIALADDTAEIVLSKKTA
jgi:DNA-binding transcriptional LysR family regulator